MVHVGDELQVTVYNHPELSRKVTVDASETLSLPLAGTIDVHGLAPGQIATRITVALSTYVQHPAVDVELTAQSTSLFVSGGPGGVLKYQPGETLAGALADLASAGMTTTPALGDTKHAGLAGLERTRVDLSRITVDRDGASLGTYDAIALSAAGNGGPEMHPGDTIVLVNKPHVVQVLGDVVTPGPTYVSAKETLADAVEQAGGISVNGATAQISLQRNGTQQTVALGDPVMHQPALDGDVITVPTAPRVSVVGLVEKPGAVLLKTDFTLINALYLAGGPSKNGDLSNVRVIHDGVSSTYDVAKFNRDAKAVDPVLADGDTVFVPQGHKVDYTALFQTLSPLFYLVRPF